VGVTHFVQDLNGRLVYEATGRGAPLREYIWLDDIPLAVFADLDTATPQLYFVHPDHLNRPLRMTDGTQAVVWDAVYKPFGEVHSITGSAALNLRFRGQYFLIENGLAYNWHRHYDPTLGRYTQPDPLEFVDGPSLYAYVRSTPTMGTDPTGEQWPQVIIGIGIVGITLFEWYRYYSNIPPFPRPLLPPPPPPEPRNSCTFRYPFGVPGAEVRNWSPAPKWPYVEMPKPPRPPRWPTK
jgi:RHS repeat-associated protein